MFKKIKNSKFLKILTKFLCFQIFRKTRYPCVRTLCSARSHQISGRYHFWFSSWSSEKMLTTWSVNGTDPFRPVFWHYDVFYDCFCTCIIMCVWILISRKVLVMYIFKYIWYFPIQTIDRIYVVKRKIDHLWPDFD